ncbi:hypothetical protein V6N13_148851 [Hibiscus sabdariffa]
MDYTVVLVDDFDVVLGLDFMVANQVIPVSSASCVMFQGDSPGVLAAMMTSKVSSVRGAGAGAVDEDVDKLGGEECCGRPFNAFLHICRGGQSADGWAGPQATDWFENKANLVEMRPCRMLLDLVAE